MSEQVARELAIQDHEPASETMRDDVLRGLSRDPKMLPSQYLYDERGARLFEKICETDEYYLTRTEIAILRRNMDAITERIGPSALLVEPGSGSGIKTRLLLEALDDPAAYVPIDMAKGQLREFAAQMDDEFPDLEVLPVCADFTNDYDLPTSKAMARKRVAYFPGSTIGNFTPDVAPTILRHLAALCYKDGGVLIGVDLKKDAAILEAAYDDARGVSREFALNYLVRLNRELAADFRPDQFGYEAPYNEVAGRIEMSLISLCRQVVCIDDAEVLFEAGERVRTEYAYKYDRDDFATLANTAGLAVTDIWTDADALFSVQYLCPR